MTIQSTDKEQYEVIKKALNATLDAFAISEACLFLQTGSPNGLLLQTGGLDKLLLQEGG